MKKMLIFTFFVLSTIISAPNFTFAEYAFDDYPNDGGIKILSTGHSNNSGSVLRRENSGNYDYISNPYNGYNYNDYSYNYNYNYGPSYAFGSNGYSFWNNNYAFDDYRFGDYFFSDYYSNYYPRYYWYNY